MTHHFETNINGGTNTVGIGENVTQYVNVTQGDSRALMYALERLGLGVDDRTTLGEALEEDGNKPGNAVKAFLASLGSGAVKIAGAVATPPAIAAVKTAITGFTGIPIA